MTLIRSGTLLNPYAENFAHLDVGQTFTSAQQFDSLSVTGSGGGRHTFDSSASLARTITIDDESGTANLTASGDRKPFTEVWSVRLSDTSAQSVNNATWTKVSNTVLKSAEIDSTGGNYATARYTASVAGDYYVGGLVTFANVGDQKKGIVAIYKNGSLYNLLARGTTSGTDLNGWAGGTALTLSASDYVELYVYHNHGSALNIGTVAGYCHFYGWNIN